MNMKWEALVFIIFYLALVAVIMIFTRKDHVLAKYDERQEFSRGKSYKAAATVMIFCAIAYYIIVAVSGRSFTEDGVSVLIIACIGLAVFSVHAILNDSFFGIENWQTGTGKPGVYAVLCAVTVIGNGIPGVRSLVSNELFKNGLLTAKCVNLVLAALFLTILIAIGIKAVLSRAVLRGES